MNFITPKIYTNELAVFPVDKNTSYEDVFEALAEGNYVLIEDLFSTGLSLLNALKSDFRYFKKTDFKASRKARSGFRDLSHRILLEVENHKLMVRKAPDIPWLKKFYPDNAYFVISFPDIQALNSSWQWYKNGISIPGLNHKIHPWYGVYFPTRFEHIELFNDWLNEYKGDENLAYDIGCGSGILSFLLERKGFDKVLATDINPNALISLKEEIKRHSYRKIDTKQGDLFAELKEEADLIVFNPPWLPENTQNTHLDQAVYYQDTLFEHFFKASHLRLKTGGKLILLFSNLLKLTHPDQPHPIEEELNNNDRFKLEKFIQKPVSKGSYKTKRDTSRRSEELVELWVLSLDNF